MKTTDGVPLVKLMMLLSSMAPLFFLIGIRGINGVVSDKYVWIFIALVIIIPHLILWFRLYRAKKSHDVYTVKVKSARNNKEYLFTYLFTVLLPLYSVSIATQRDLIAIFSAVLFILFVLWNMNLHFINIMFALMGYRVFILEDFNSAILLTKRTKFPSAISELNVHRLSNSVYIELN
ncbi:MAG: hypothetical protein ORN24_02490 [Burkholderiales bacterium]|nr:hypothetical protein [Burkholderiales bacterium]